MSIDDAHNAKRRYPALENVWKTHDSCPLSFPLGPQEKNASRDISEPITARQVMGEEERGIYESAFKMGFPAMDAERLGGPSALAGERQPMRATETADAEWLERRHTLTSERYRRRR